MVCPCGTGNPAGAKFCLECGAPIVRRCTDCAVELPPGAKFCPECGRPASGARSEPARREIRKVVTIVFVDLAGSTSLQEHMDPESVRRVMERFSTMMRSEIEAAEGLVVKLTGDGLMAGFGIREAREDDALRAVRAAVAMQESFRDFAAEVRDSRGADVSLRVGINTGEVVVAEEDDDVVGDVVNVAARLEHAAGDGNVLVGDETWRLTRDDVTFAAVDPLELRGKGEPVPAYRVVSLEPPTEDEGVAAPFVGRGAELARLQEAFERSVSTRSPSIITVVGSPGLGKTRIASEFVSAVSGQARVLEARCDRTGTTTYAPIAEALREAAGIAETASGAEVIASIQALVSEDFAEKQRVAKVVASLLGVGEAAAPQETFWAVRRLLEGLAAFQPVVLVVDDVQWAEPMMFDLLDHLVEWAKGAPIMILPLARPEIRDVRPSLLDAGSVVLEGLNSDHTAALASSLLGAHDLPPGLVGRILTTTEGNPLFVRELLRMLVDDGVLHRDGKRWVATVQTEEIHVPATINALLSARIERLQQDERAVVERASVVGKEFYRGAVIDLVPANVGSLIDTHLETLRRKELVEPEGTYWIDERVFRFHHVLIRDAAYRRLLKEARAELHERFADWLQTKVGDLVGEHDEVLGYHLEQAHTYLDELGAKDGHTMDLGRRASAHLASATRRALDRDDLAAAANLSERALLLTDDDAARALILLDRCEALLGMGDVGAARDAVSELRARASDDRLRAWADCFDGQLAILTDPSRLRETATIVEDAARRLAELGDDTGAAKGHAVHAEALGHLGQFGACEAALDRALAAARESGDRRRANGVLSSAPLAALWGPNPVPRASGRCLDVVRVLRITQGAPAVEATALRCQAVLEAMRGRTDAAHRMLASARSTLEELGLRHALVECDLFTGLIDLLAGDHPGAEASFRSAYEGFRGLNVGTDTAQAAALLARALVEQGHDDEALELTEESERLGGDDLKTAIAWRTVRARALARRGDLDAATDLARAAVALAEPTDALIDHADARLALAEVLRVAGRDDEARTESRKGEELYARKEATGGAAAPVPHTPVDEDGGRRTGGVRLAHDWTAMTSFLTPDHVFVDHRSWLRSELTGGPEWVEVMRCSSDNLDPEQIDEARRRRAEGHGSEILGPLDAFGRRWEEAFRTGSGAELAALYTPGFRVVEHTNHIELDLQTHLESMQRVAAQPGARARVETVVRLGARHGVNRTIFSWEQSDGLAGPSEVAGVSAVRIDHEGRCPLFEWFPAELLHRALARAEELYIEEEAAGQALAGARRRLAHWRMADAHNDGDWETFAALWAPDAVLVDRRQIGWAPTEGREAIVELIRAIGARSVRHTWSITDVHAVADDGCVYTLPTEGIDRDGGRYEQGGVCISLLTDEGLSRVEIFPFDAVDEAMRRFEELRSRPATDHPPATVGEWFGRVEACLGRGDLAGYGALWSEDVVNEERRPLLRSVTSGRQAMMDSLLHVKDLAAMRLESEVIATRGDRLELRLVRYLGKDVEGGTFDVPVLQVHEMNEQGLVCRAVCFEPEDTTAAFDELDGRYGSILPAGQAEYYRTMLNLREIYNDHDWERWAALFHPDVSVVDHRPVGWGSFRGFDRLMSLMRGLVDLIPDAKVTVPSIERLTDSVLLNPARVSGTDTNGNTVELTYHLLFASKNGMIERYELFPVDEREAALARAGELADGNLPSTTLERAWQRWLAAQNARDTDSIAAQLAPDFVLRDHVYHFELDREATLADLQGVLDVPGSFLPGRVLPLGDRHGLLQFTWSREQGRTVGESHMTRWFTVRCDDDGTFLVLEWYSESDLLEALERAEELYLEDEATGDDATASRRRLAFWRTVLAYNAGDWEGVRSGFHRDVTTIDHRPAGWGRLEGRDAYLETIRRLAEMAPDRRWDVRSVEFEGACLLLDLDVVGTDENGGRFVLPYVAVIVVGDSGVETQALFTPEQREKARACYATPLDLPAQATGSTIIERAWESFLNALNERDFSRIREMHAPDFRLIERAFHLEMGLDDQLTNLEGILSSPGSFRSGRSFTLGERHGALEMIWSLSARRTVGESEVRTWSVNRCNADGVFLNAEIFPENQMREALERAEELYLEDEAAPDDADWSEDRLRMWRAFRAYDAGDADA